MMLKRPLSISPNRYIQKQSSSIKTGICQVCGDNARVVNYGARSCSSCRTFFRRHGFHFQNVPSCYYKGNCSIDIETRKFCTACRFAKCLAVGMSPELIRKEDLHEKYRPSKKTTPKFISKEIMSFSQPCPLNLLSTDISSLTTDSWRLLSNVIHAFDTYNCVPITSTIVRSVGAASLYVQPDIQKSLDIMTQIYTSLQSFIDCTPDFRIMTNAEQRSLLQRNMQGLLAFYCLFAFRESGVFYNRKTENSLIPLYGYDNVDHTKHLCALLDDDLTMVKLMLMTLTFSSNCYMITEEHSGSEDSLLYGVFRLFGSQNVYAELLWVYMIYRYDFCEAVRRFDGLIKVALNALTLASNIYDSNKIHQNFADELAVQTEFALKLNDPEDIPLWGKN